MKKMLWIAASALLLAVQHTCALAQTYGEEVVAAQPTAATMAPGGEGLRPQAAALLKAAQAKLDQNKPALALRTLREVDALPGLNGWESYVLARLRLRATVTKGDDRARIAAFTALLATPYLDAAERLVFERGLAGMYIQTKQEARLIEAMAASITAGSDRTLSSYLALAYAATGDYLKAARVQESVLRHPRPDDPAAELEDWKLLANLCNIGQDRKCYLQAIEQIASRRYAIELMTDALNRLSVSEKVDDRLRVEILRLRQQIVPFRPADVMAFARFLLLDGAYFEANNLVETAFASGVLGKGADAPRHERLKVIVSREYAAALAQRDSAPPHFMNAKQFDKVATLGFDLAHAGDADKAIALMEQALASGALRDSNVARLHLGMTYASVGRHDEAALQMARISPDDDLSTLGRFWLIQSRQSRPAK
jgi:hypothetical protein